MTFTNGLAMRQKWSNFDVLCWYECLYPWNVHVNVLA